MQQAFGLGELTLALRAEEAGSARRESAAVLDSRGVNTTIPPCRAEIPRPTPMLCLRLVSLTAKATAACPTVSAHSRKPTRSTTRTMVLIGGQLILDQRNTGIELLVESAGVEVWA